jgi:hypothetical protein
VRLPQRGVTPQRAQMQNEEKTSLLDFKARNAILLSLYFLFAFPCAAQSGASSLQPGAISVSVPTIMFELEWPSSDPPHYSISIDSEGRAAYTASPPSTEATGAPYKVEWTATDPTRTRIFQLAEKTNFFSGVGDSGDKRIAYTGTKTLTFMEGSQSGSLTPTNGINRTVTYNWSNNPSIQQLTQLFEDISTTIEFGRKLQHDARFDKLGLDNDLKRMDELQQQKRLPELRAIKPVLLEIEQDPQVMNIVRQRVKQLLLTGG